jgi:hypothetical protein
MKILLLVVRLLMGLMFFVFGLNAFFNFIHAPLPPGLAGQFASILFQSHYLLAVGAVQTIGGFLLLINRYVPLALTLLGPVIVNILLFHFLLTLQGVGGALLVTIFWFILFFHLREHFAGIFVQRTN